ncbi:biotin/lipoyl-binding protein [Massilia sp. MB5]|uniref:biotin/lipoyl-binding protein n=1 Tax=Massilia sp. MB5 TaxID=2919578 RepID=UPI001F0EA8F1|nr:biotin/lipoyl-binding protein [Massilia sp. MB5]UMR31009.1 biotin/lipoyl-binding protein [Massilia sp. MB5]
MMTNMVPKKAEAAEVIAHDVTPLEVKTDASRYSKLGWLMILLGFGGFLLWATLAPLDKGVPMPGFVVAEGNRKAVQHQTGGTIADILVKDGDVVKKGQVLVRMNNVQANSQIETTRAQYITARLAEARLLAERDGKKALEFPSTLETLKSDPRVVAGFSLQNQLFSSRRASLESELGAYDENVAGLRSQMKGLEESRDAKKAQIGFLKEQLDNTRDLAAKAMWHAAACWSWSVPMRNSPVLFRKMSETWAALSVRSWK